MKTIDYARGYSRLGLYKKAVKIYYEIITDEPRNATANYELGECLYKTSNLDGSLKFCSIAVELDPDLLEAYLLLGTLLEQRKQYENAEQYLRRAFQLNPLNASTANRLGVCLLRQGHVEESLQMFQRAIDADTNFSKAHLNAALIYFKSDQVSLSLEHGWKAFKNSGSLVAFYWLLIFGISQYTRLYGLLNIIMAITLVISSSKIILFVAVCFLFSILLIASMAYKTGRKGVTTIYIISGLVILLWYLVRAFVV